MPSLFNNQYANLASKGRYGDTMLAHINPQEAGLLRAMGGAGTINPQTGLREFYGQNQIGLMPQVALEPLPVLAQAFDPNTFQNIPDKLNTITVPQEIRGMGGSTPAYDKVSDNYLEYADRSPAAGQGGGSQIQGYTIPTEQTFQGKPLAAKYDAKGNFQYLQLAGGNVLYPDPNQPNIASSPKFNKSGGIIDYGVFDVSQQGGGGFGDFISELGTEFAPMILASLGAQYLGGSGLFGSAGAAGGVALSPYAAQAAGAYGAGGAAAATTAAQIAAGAGGANFMSPSLISSAGGAGGAATTAANAVAGAAGSSVTPSMLQSIANATGISVDTLKTFGPSVIQGLIGAGGSALTANQATDAARTQAEAQIRAAQIAADAARFRPVGVTTRFGSSNFQTDAAGNVISAGYTPSAEILGYQDRLSALANQGLTDVEGARAAYQPLTGAAQSLFTLGQGYLAKTPEEAAQDYIKKQQALLAPSQQSQLAQLQNQLFQQGRGGVAVSQGGDLMNTNPEMAAYYNSLAQSNLVLAAQADQEARNQILFGAGLFGTGADLQGQYYSGQTAAYAPFTTAMDVTSGLESLAQVPLTLGTQIGAQTTAGAANAGLLTSQGIMNAANTMAPANAYSLGGNILSGAANSPMLAGAINQGFGNTQPSQQMYTLNSQGQFVPVQQSVWST
jgi:hypothetical protein